jgi:hypothetical protein
LLPFLEERRNSVTATIASQRSHELTKDRRLWLTRPARAAPMEHALTARLIQPNDLPDVGGRAREVPASACQEWAVEEVEVFGTFARPHRR